MLYFVVVLSPMIIDMSKRVGYSGHSHVRDIRVGASLTIPSSGSSVISETYLCAPHLVSVLISLNFHFLKGKNKDLRPISLRFWQNIGSKHKFCQFFPPRPLFFKEKNPLCRPYLWETHKKKKRERVPPVYNIHSQLLKACHLPN